MKKKVFGNFNSDAVTAADVPIVIIPVPYDGTSTWIKGADKGPSALLEASRNLEFYDIETDSEVYKKGIFTDIPVSEAKTPEAMVQSVYKRVKEYIPQEKFVVLIGGEHSVSIGAIQAHAECYKEISVLQLDAHSDLRDEYEGSKNNHACVMARAKEVSPIIQVGIRSMSASEKTNMDKKRVFFAKDICSNNREKWIEAVISQLTENVYVTIDLDVFDPAFVPSTGTPEPGGLNWYDVKALMRAVAEKKNLIGFDIVELCPNPYNKASDFLAAKLLYKILTYKFCLK